MASPEIRIHPHPWVAAGAERLRYGIATGLLPDWSTTRDFARAAEALGFDSIWFLDHPLAASSNAWTSLAALAEATTSIRLGTLVSCVSYRNPVLLARDVADVDRISGGRVVLGLGSGDMPWEFQQMGLGYPPARERQAALEEAIEIIMPLLEGQRVDFSGRHFHVNAAQLAPPATQQPHVPLLVKGDGEPSSLRLAARYADAVNVAATSWAGHAFSAEDVRHKFETLRGHARDLGRADDALLSTSLLLPILSDAPQALRAKAAAIPPALLSFFEQLVVSGPAEAALARVQALVDAGTRYLIFLVFPFDDETLELLARRVIPAVRDELPAGTH